MLTNHGVLSSHSSLAAVFLDLFASRYWYFLPSSQEPVCQRQVRECECACVFCIPPALASLAAWPTGNPYRSRRGCGLAFSQVGLLMGDTEEDGGKYSRAHRCRWKSSVVGRQAGADPGLQSRFAGLNQTAGELLHLPFLNLEPSFGAWGPGLTGPGNKLTCVNTVGDPGRNVLDGGS